MKLRKRIKRIERQLRKLVKVLEYESYDGDYDGGSSEPEQLLDPRHPDMMFR